MRYGVIWHPASHNLGDDLQTLAAGRLLPRIDTVLDGERLDEAPGEPGEDIITLMGGHAMRRKYHWPPHPSLRPVCLGLHLSREDAWGCPMEVMEGVGLDYLRAHGPVGCRDDATADLLDGLGVEHYVSCCLTLTLDRPGDVARKQRYVCCVDIPDKAVEELRRYEKVARMPLRVMTHQLPPEAARESFQERMARAEETLRVYAGASWVVTRRLHCALACVAMEVPVLFLYNSGYEDVRRFSPMDGLFSVAAVEDFISSVHRNGFPALAENPGKYLAWRRLLREKAQEGLRRAAEAPAVPAPDPAAVAAWQRRVLVEMAKCAAEKIDRLEKEQYDLIHDKFGLLLTEDSVKARIQDCLTQPGLEDDLRRFTARRYLATLPWWKRGSAKRRFKRLYRARKPVEELEERDVLTLITGQLARLGWPTDKPTKENPPT